MLEFIDFIWRRLQRQSLANPAVLVGRLPIGHMDSIWSSAHCVTYDIGPSSYPPLQFQLHHELASSRWPHRGR
jgi:hypothetical protein